MRSLNTSLPASAPHPSRVEPPEHLLQAFKTAALSVTNLYKTAVSDQAGSRHAGYQEALEDMRAFMDREAIGQDGGEASKIRRWVMDRIDGTASSNSDSDDERPDSTEKPTATAVERSSSSSRHATDSVSRSSSPPQQETSLPTETALPPPPLFTFTAGPQFPSLQPQEMEMHTNDATNTMHTEQLNSPSNVKVEVIPRASRTPHRTGTANRHGSRSSYRDNTMTGSKRKFQLGDFFDISNVDNGRDAFGGMKRGRFI